MLKGIVNDVPKDIIRIPMKGKNLFDYVSYFNATFTPFNEFFNYGEIQLLPNTTYTLSTSYGEYVSKDGTRVTAFIAATTTQQPKTSSGGLSNISPVTITTESDGIIKLYKRISRATSSNYFPTKSQFDSGKWLMLNAGSTALPYEPYGMQNGWEVRDQQGTILWGADKTLTGTDSISFKGYGLPLTSWTVQGNTQQSGTPSPQSIIMPTFCGKLVGSDWTVPLTCAGQTVPVYLGQTQTVRRIAKIIYTGEEDVTLQSINTYGIANFQMPTVTGRQSKNGDTVSTHFKLQLGGISSIKESGFYVNDINVLYFRIESSLIDNADDFKAYLAAQYANGTPVTVWYVLATEQTGIVNEPLCKIGDYADELHSENAAVTIPTANGNNTLTVDTTLPPSKTTIKVHAKPVHYGFKIDKTNDNSDTAVTYTHDAVTMTPAAMNFSTGVFSYGSWENVWFVKDAYPVALNLNGTEAYRLDPDDYTKKFDGTPSDIQYVLLTEEPADWSTQWKQYYHKTGDVYELNDQNEAPAFTADTYYQLTSGTFAGNFMVAFPKVYFKRTEDATYNYVEISNVKLSDDWHAYAHINANGDEVDSIYLPMFKGSIVSSKLRSIPGKTPQGGTTADQEVTAAAACGSRWQIWDHSSRELINDLLILLCKSIDSQGKFGKGRESGYNANDTVTYGKLQTGTLVSKGKFYGYSSSYKDVKVFGIEGFWANRFDRIQGILLIDNVWQIKMAPPYNFTGTSFQTLSTASVPDGDDYLSKVQTSQYGSIPASISGGGSTKFYRDYFYKTATGTRVAVVGGYCGSGVNCGFRYVGVGGAASGTGWHIGASPIYK